MKLPKNNQTKQTKKLRCQSGVFIYTFDTCAYRPLGQPIIFDFWLLVWKEKSLRFSLWCPIHWNPDAKAFEQFHSEFKIKICQLLIPLQERLSPSKIWLKSFSRLSIIRSDCIGVHMIKLLVAFDCRWVRPVTGFFRFEIHVDGQVPGKDPGKIPSKDPGKDPLVG